MKITTLRKKRKIFYKKIRSVYCSILDTDVYFTSEGFNHLIYKSSRKPRNVNEQYMKLSFLKDVPKVIEKCSNVPNIRRERKTIRGKTKMVVWYELVHEVTKGKKVRVIVQKIGQNGKHKFHSVMPHDKEARRHVKTKKRRGSVS